MPFFLSRLGTIIFHKYQYVFSFNLILSYFQNVNFQSFYISEVHIVTVSISKLIKCLINLLKDYDLFISYFMTSQTL